MVTSSVIALVPDHSTAADYLARLEGVAAAASQPTDPADAAWNAGDTELAFELYLARLEGDALDPVATLRVALVTAWQGDYRGSLRLLDGLMERDPRHVDARLARARVLAWSGDLDRAEDEVLEILGEQPDHPEALEALALFRAWDTDHDGLLTHAEIVDGIQQAALERGIAKNVDNAFRLQDADHDGALRPEEMGLLGREFHHFDTNGDGEVSRAELERIYGGEV